MTADIPSALKGELYTVEPILRIGPVRIGSKLGDRIEPGNHNLPKDYNLGVALVRESNASGEEVGEMAKIIGPGRVLIAPFDRATYDQTMGEVIEGLAINKDPQLRGRLRWVPS